MNNFNIGSILNKLSFTQLIKIPTRGQRTLDVFITNVPNYWKGTKVVKSLVRSDHDMVITYLRDTVKAKRTNSYFRDVRDHCKLAMLRELESQDWNMTTSNIKNLDEMTLKFYETVQPNVQLIRDNQFNAVKQLDIGSHKPDRKEGGLMQITSLFLPHSMSKYIFKV